MTTISLRLPDSLHQAVKQLSEADKISINQFITLAVAEKLSALMTESHLAERSRKGSREKFLAALDKAPDVAPDEGDG